MQCSIPEEDDGDGVMSDGEEEHQNNMKELAGDFAKAVKIHLANAFVSRLAHINFRGQSSAFVDFLRCMEIATNNAVTDCVDLAAAVNAFPSKPVKDFLGNSLGNLIAGEAKRQLKARTRADKALVGFKQMLIAPCRGFATLTSTSAHKHLWKSFRSRDSTRLRTTKMP